MANQMITTHAYSVGKQRANCYVRYAVDNEEHYGIVRNILSADNCVKVVVERGEQMVVDNIEKFPSNVKRVTMSKRRDVVIASNIKQRCIFMPYKTYSLFIDFVNYMESS